MSSRIEAPTGQALATFIAFANKVAQNRRDDAGYSGAYHDGGARDLEEKIKAWHAGIEGVVPDCLQTIWSDHQRSMDPEYQEYLRLQKKFK